MKENKEQKTQIGDNEDSYINTLFHSVEKGKKGENKGINIPGEMLKKYLPNIQRKYYLILSGSGVGKTSFAHYMFLFNPFIQWYKGNIEDLEIVYLTNEMTIEEVIGQFVCFLYYQETNKIADLNILYSQGDHEITEDLEDFIKKDETKEILSLFEQKVQIKSEILYSGFIYKTIMDTARENGEIIEEISKDNKKYIKDYIKENDNKEIIIVVDNFTKIIPSGDKREMLKKNAVDLVSSYLDTARYKFGFITVGLQQVNRNTSAIDKMKIGDYFPTEKDAKESENPFHDAQVVFSQISPWKDNIQSFDKIPVKEFKDRLRVIKIIKNRGGIAYKIIPYIFLGEFSYYKEFSIENINSIVEKMKKITK